MRQRRMKWDLAAAVAVLTILGPGLVTMHQVGRYAYYDIPFELLEINAYQLLTSGLSLLFAVASTVFLATTLVNGSEAPKARAERLARRMVLAGLLSMPIWVEDFEWGGEVSWPTVGLIGLIGWGLWGVESVLAKRRPRGEPVGDRIGRWAHAAFVSALAILVLAVAHGYQTERGRTHYTFVAATERAIIGKFGDSLITKEYDPRTRRFKPSRTVLVIVEDTLVLEGRRIDRVE